MKRTITTGMAITTPDLMMAERGTTTRIIQTTLMMLDTVDMVVRITAMTTTTLGEEATLLPICMVHLHRITVTVTSTACLLLLELRTMTHTTPMDTITLMLITIKGRTIRDMGSIIPLPPAAGVILLMVVSTP